ncbi:hypothetical protein [Bradyrhizobium sp.]|uniref:hypothetical protein n=1 Tax=Bradyrhizobium sp. TaxID=376 RepID=UPI003BAE53E8
MRAPLLLLTVLVAASTGVAHGQMKLSTKPAPGANDVRYFTSIDGLMDGNADVVLKETRQGKTLTAATLDVCYPVAKGSDRKDRFVVNLAINGQTLSGTTQSVSGKLPVTVKLTRKPAGENFEFKGQIGIGQTVTEVNSTDNSDISEREFQESQTSDDGITPSPKDFTEVSPEAIGVRVKLDAVADFLKSLKGQDVEVSLTSLAVTCDVLRAGEQTITLSADPDRAAALIAKFKQAAGVIAAGWTTGIIEMDRTIRFSAAPWRDGDRLNKEKLATTIANVLAGAFSAKPATSAWNSGNGKLKLTFKRSSEVYPSLNLTDTVEVTALVSSEKPGGSDRLILWVGAPVISTADETSGSALVLANDASGDEEGAQKDDNGLVDALTKEFKGQRWDADKSVWK